MNITDTNFWEQVKKIFFEALLAGYAGKNDDPRVVKSKSLDDKEKTFTFIDADFIVIDRYYVTSNSDYSCGYTVILFQGNPIWFMNYGGFYPKSPKDVISLLKEALGVTYSKGEFNGGRGPFMYSAKGLVYYNAVAKGDFFKFSGREEIRRVSLGENGIHVETLIGEHVYSGMRMI